MGVFGGNLAEKDHHQIMANNNIRRIQGSQLQTCSTKVERRVVEKNRRNHMKVLYSKLNSLLPSQNSKEPLSLPDQIDEAIKYIKGLEAKLQKSKDKKESLLITTSTTSRKRSHTCTNFATKLLRRAKSPEIHINEIDSTIIEVILISGLDNHQFMFYEIIRILDQEEADVVHASFSTLGDSILHSVRAEMGKSMVDFGAARITEKLTRFVNGSTSDELQEQDSFWDLEISPEMIWDQF